MNELVTFPAESLPTLIDRASAALASARTSAEVLEARDLSRVAYDAAKSAARMMNAKRAHDSLIADVHRAQANALAIRARAEMRLAEEYDDAQERGDILRSGEHSFSHPEKLSGVDVLPPKDLHEARKFRDAEAAEPGLISRAIDAMIERGEEPTRAALRRDVFDRAPPQRVMNPKALWLWGRIKDFERDGVLSQSPTVLLSEMTEPMRADVRRLLPDVVDFLANMEREL
jgi:hypothetical protein